MRVRGRPPWRFDARKPLAANVCRARPTGKDHVSPKEKAGSGQEDQGGRKCERAGAAEAAAPALELKPAFLREEHAGRAHAVPGGAAHTRKCKMLSHRQPAPKLEGS